MCVILRLAQPPAVTCTRAMSAQQATSTRAPTELHGWLAAGVLGTGVTLTMWSGPWLLMMLYIILDRTAALPATAPVIAGVGLLLAVLALATVAGVFRVVQVRRPVLTLLLGGATVLVAMVAYALLHALATDTAGMPDELWPLGVAGFLAFAGWARLL